MRASTLSFAIALTVVFAGCGPRPSPEQKQAAIAAFDTVQTVFQHPRCANCHIPGDQPLQFDTMSPHTMGVVRGPEGHGAPGLPCSTCHGEKNPPASYGPHAPPGAPHWGLPPPGQKMDWMLEATREVRRRWHNQKYFTWVEQQGKTAEDLRGQEEPAFWIAHQERASVIDRTVLEKRRAG